MVIVMAVSDSFAANLSSLSDSALLSRHRELEARLIRHVRMNNSPIAITNASAMYTAAWIGSSEAVPVLLEMLCATKETRAFPERAVPVSALDWSRGNLPSLSDKPSAPCWFYVVPPTPAAAALTQSPVRLEMLMEELEQSEIDSERMRLLAWVAMAKYGIGFSTEAAGRAFDGNGKWKWILEYSRTNLYGASPFDLQQFRPEIWSDVVWEHDRIVAELRRRFESGKQSGDAARLASATEALSEIGELPCSPQNDGTVVRASLLLEEYSALCSNAVSHVRAGLSENTVSNADEVYLVGWLRAQEAVPFLLSIIDYPSREPLQFLSPDRGDSLIAPHLPPPQPPALGALLLLECPMNLITNAMIGAGGNERKLQALVRLGQQKFSGDFERLLDSLAPTGEPVWREAVRLCEDNPILRDDSWIQDRIRFFPQEDVRRYKELFWVLRLNAENAERHGMNDLFSELSDALSEIGHPFDEDRLTWP